MNDVILRHWPSDRLEEVGTCPACGCQKNKILESALVDLQSKPVTGFWTMRLCEGCGIAYLSPRPDRNSIVHAYRHYYTHSSDKDNLVFGKLRLFKDYLSGKYYAVTANSGGFLNYFVYLMLRVLPPVSAYLDAKSRHIFKLKEKPGKLLDVGCGNGEFLRFANRFGWDVVGVDFDQQAVSEASSSGLDVRSGDVNVINSKEKFDFITLSHVIEHVYDPAVLLSSCYKLLNEGGVLWLETPNIESMGYAIYKSSWRGLEPPRHIMLFNRDSLNKLLLNAGFASVDQKYHGLSGLYMGLSSEKMLNEVSPCHSRTDCVFRKILMLMRTVSLEIMQLFCKRRREFLTLVAFR